MKKVTYIMDPYCAWCFAGAENVQRLYETFKNQVEFDILPASMLTHEYAFDYSPAMLAQQEASMARITEVTGTAFGDDYRATLQREEKEWNSTTACAAIEAVRKVAPEQLFPFTTALLKARFVAGKDLDDTKTFTEIAASLGIDAAALEETMKSGEVLDKVEFNFTFVDTYADVYPTLVYEADGGVKTRLEEGYAPYEALASQLETLLGGEAVEESAGRSHGCKNGVCSI